MSLVNDIIILNIFIPKLVVIGFISAFVFIFISKWIERTNILKHFWHPRLILWSFSCAIYALILIVLEK